MATKKGKSTSTMTEAEQTRYAAAENEKAAQEYAADPNHPKYKPAGHVAEKNRADMIGGATKEEVAQYERERDAQNVDTKITDESTNDDVG
jgi:hypothetical protein